MTDCDILFSLEAEESVLGYFLNGLVETEQRQADFLLLSPDLFYDEIHRGLYFCLKFVTADKWDKIILWDSIKTFRSAHELFARLEYKDLEELNDGTSRDEFVSYYKILLDKAQKRSVYHYGDLLKSEIMKGTDQYTVAISASIALSELSESSGLKSNEDLLEEVFDESEGDLIDTGYDSLTEHVGGWTRGNIIVIPGDSGHMKTTFVLDNMYKVAERNRLLRLGVFSKEMLTKEMMQKSISRNCRIPMNDVFRKKYDPDHVREVMNSVPGFADNRIRVIGPNQFRSVEDIMRIQMAERFDVWYVDFLQLLEGHRGQALSSSDFNMQIAANMRGLKSLALATKSVGIILSQLKKGVDQREIKKPLVSDIEWSGVIKQLAAYILFSYYPHKYYPHKFGPEYHFLLGEKTRFAAQFIFPTRVEPEYGYFEEIPDRNERKLIVEPVYQLDAKDGQKYQATKYQQAEEIDFDLNI